MVGNTRTCPTGANYPPDRSDTFVMSVWYNGPVHGLHIDYSHINRVVFNLEIVLFMGIDFIIELYGFLPRNMTAIMLSSVI